MLNLVLQIYRFHTRHFRGVTGETASIIHTDKYPHSYVVVNLETAPK